MIGVGQKQRYKVHIEVTILFTRFRSHNVGKKRTNMCYKRVRVENIEQLSL